MRPLTVRQLWGERKASKKKRKSRDGKEGNGRGKNKRSVVIDQQIHGRNAPGACTASLAAAFVRFATNVLAPDHTSCRPAQMATAATTAFSLRAGTFRASKHPRTTPGTPPASTSSKMGVLIEPKVQCTALPMIARTSPNAISVPTTCAG